MKDNEQQETSEAARKSACRWKPSKERFKETGGNMSNAAANSGETMT